MISTIILTAAVLLLTILLALPLGRYMHRVYSGDRFWATRLMGPVERGLYRITGVSADQEMGWKRYAVALLIFNLIGGVFLYALLLAQGALPLDPQHFKGVPSSSAFNTAVSFLTATNWQDYAGESTMSFLSQMLGLTVQNFLGAATGMAMLLAIMRGIARQKVSGLGNFWVDMTRTVLYVLFPLSSLVAFMYMEQGAVQTLAPYVRAHLMVPFVYGTKTITHQLIAVGPSASQEAITILGGNGGGFFNAASTHPFENPTGLTNFLHMLSFILIPTAIVILFGHMTQAPRTARALLAAMLILFIPLVLVSEHYELAGNPLLSPQVAQTNIPSLAGGGNMEGVEDRFGAGATALFASLATASGAGISGGAYDSMIPLSGGVNLFFMQMGEVAFGGVGTGLATMLAFVIFSVFLGGLMIGRTPEFLGKKITAFELKMASLSILIMPVCVLIATALAVTTEAGRAGAFNPGPHGFSEILYAFTSTANNNGSAFGGLNSDTRFYNLSTALCMLIGRYLVYLPLLAMAGALAGKQKVPSSAGTLTTHTPIFIGLLVGVVLLIGALNFFPALALGPIAEQLAPLATLTH